MEPDVLRVKDAAKRLGLGRIATYRAIKRGEIPVLKFGRRIVVPVPMLEEMLRTGRVPGAQTQGGDSR